MSFLSTTQCAIIVITKCKNANLNVGYFENNYESEEVMFMGPFDKEANNPLDDMFDMNGDGYLSSSEEAMKYDF